MQAKTASFQGLFFARAVVYSKSRNIRKYRRKFSRANRVIFQVHVQQFRSHNLAVGTFCAVGRSRRFRQKFSILRPVVVLLGVP